MKNLYKLFLILIMHNNMIHAEPPAIDTIRYHIPIRHVFTAHNDQGQWQGTITATGMWTMQMHRGPSGPLTSCDLYITKFIMKRLVDRQWGWQLQTSTGNTATYSTADVRLKLKLKLISAG